VGDAPDDSFLVNAVSVCLSACLPYCYQLVTGWLVCFCHAQYLHRLFNERFGHPPAPLPRTKQSEQTVRPFRKLPDALISSHAPGVT